MSWHHLDYANCSWDRMRKSKVLTLLRTVTTVLQLSAGENGEKHSVVDCNHLAG